MKISAFDWDGLKQELEGIKPLHQIAFAASCCERLLPNYTAFSRLENWGDPVALRTTLDEIWQFLAGMPMDAIKAYKLKQILDSENIAPDMDDFGAVNYGYEALEAVNAIHQTLEACIKLTPEFIIRVAESNWNTIDAFVNQVDSLSGVTVTKALLEEQIKSINNHPLMIREMAKENEDLQRLKEVATLDSNFLEWLRTSSQNNGKSLIDPC